MTRDIQPLTLADLPELSRFLVAGFHAQPEADFAAPDVLRWKYLDDQGSITAAGGDPYDDGSNPQGPAAEQERDATAEPGAGAPRSYIARDESGPIIGHLGLCRTDFEGQGIAAEGGRVATIHLIDWIGSREHRSLGISLLRLAHQEAETQFHLGVSQAASAVGERVGYELRSVVAVYTHVFQSGYWLRTSGLGPLERGLGLVRDAVSRLTRRTIAPRTSIVLERAAAFGDEITPVVAKARERAILTRRDPARLNAFLRFPRQAMSGWHLFDDTGRLRGFALLNLLSKDHGRTRTGKIVDCVLDDIEVDLWHGATLALTRELANQGADLAEAYASTPWTAEALRRSGYSSRFGVKLNVRDRLKLIPQDATFHITPLEGDYAYT